MSEPSTMLCFFVSDLHGNPSRYNALFRAIEHEKPKAVFLGGDLLPSFGIGEAMVGEHDNFFSGFLAPRLDNLRNERSNQHCRVFAILGNDDPRYEEAIALDLGVRGLWEYVHDKRVTLEEFNVYGYSCVPPSPFRLKDWERYDVSRYTDPGCVSPEDGAFSLPIANSVIRHSTILKDLEALLSERDLSRSIILFHSPPYQTDLDRAALDGKFIEHVPLDVHVGSIAIKRLIEERSPRITLHGHIHESPRLTGSWKQKLGNTWMFSAAHDGPELALVRFDPAHPENASRELIR